MVTHDIAEAICMADKVIILSNRPSHIKKIIDVNFDDKTTPINNRKCSLVNASNMKDIPGIFYKEDSKCRF